MDSVQQLEINFPLAELSFHSSEQGSVLVSVDNAFASGSVSLSGANILSWQPKDSIAPVIWLSEEAKLTPGKSVRGGVPVCWPWFGAHGSEADFPAHGYARTSVWELVEAQQLATGETEITLSLADDQHAQRFCSPGVEAKLRITIGEKLGIELITINQSSKSFVLSEALHTYFYISDIAKVRVLGLEGVEYLDKVDGFARKTQNSAITFDEETDRVYVNTVDECVIKDQGLDRSIHIAKAGSSSTVVWSPGKLKADAMGDLGADEGWRKMVCVESANAADNVLSIDPGAQHSLSVEYWLA